MIKLTLSIAAAAGILVIAGCGSTAPVAPTASPQPSALTAPQPSSVADNRVIIDNTLDRALRVLKVFSLTGRDGLLKIQIDIQNITDSPRLFGYRLEWFDENGKLLPISAGTQSWMLLAHETSSIVATAPAETAKDFGVAFLPAAQ